MPAFLVGFDDSPVARAALAFTRRLAGDAARVVVADAEDSASADSLAELAREEEATLIAVGSGTTGEQLLHDAPCPVLVVPEAFADREIRSIGVAYDARPESRRALFVAESLAEAVDASLVVIRVADSDDLRAVADGLRHTAARSRARGLRAGGQLLVGPPGPSLAAAASGVDLLVMGSRGHGPVRTVLLGSVSRELVEDARCPILITPRAALATPVRPVLA
jgi:nucleotide-binding universal stress UspA family protein